ncbi:MAG: ATP-binding protein, partial [Polyangiaceae bacterium]
HVALQSGEAIVPIDELGLDSAEERQLALLAWKKGELVEDPTVAGLNLWLTLKGAHRSVGLLGLDPRNPKRFRDPGERQLLLGCAAQLAGAIERLLLSGATHRAELQAETERTRSSLLAAVSHDLRNPLSAILTAASTAARVDSTISDEERRDLMRTIVAESERLNRLVANLLSMTKLESGEIALQRLPEDMAELFESAIRALSAPNAATRIGVQIELDLPPVDVDAVLIEQALINLLENALRHAPSDSLVQLEASNAREGVLVRVIDHGPGIRLEEREKVFEKFFRGSRATRDGGAGLGLTICRAAVLAHHGRIRALETPGGGATLEFTLPRATLSGGLEDD